MKKNLVKMVCIFLALAMLAGCGTKENSENNKKADEKAELTKVKMSYFPSASWAPAFVAKEKGFFEEEGLEVEFTSPGGPKGFQALQAGDCEFAFLSMEPALIAAEKGMKTTFFTTVVQGRYYGVVTSGDITEISQLKGKNVYGGGPGSGPYVFLCDVLKSAGLNPETDVTFVNMEQSNTFVALEKGEISGAFIEMYMVHEMEGKDMNLLVDTRNEEDCIKYLGSADFPVEGICTTPKYAEENPEIVQAVTNAILKAAKWMDENSDEEIAKLLSGAFEGVDEKRLTEWVNALRGFYVTDGIISQEGYAAVNEANIHAGVISAPIPYEDMVDSSFAENAEY